MTASRGTSIPRGDRLRLSNERPSQHRERPGSAAATPASAQKQTPPTERRSRRSRPLSQRPPENSLGGETRQRFDVADEFCACFLDIALQPFLCQRDQLPSLGRCALDEAGAMGARFGAELLAQLSGVPLRFVQALLDSIGG